MAFSPRGVQPKSSSNGRNADGSSMNVGNRLGARPTTQKGAYAQKNESGSAMKSLLGGAENDEPGRAPAKRFTVENPMRPATFGGWGGAPCCNASQQQQQQQQQQASGSAMRTLLTDDDYYYEERSGAHEGPIPAPVDDDEIEYPLPGCRASCDGCGVIVQRFYHCAQCADPDLVDLCPSCCAGVYLPPDKRPPGLKAPRLEHPTHDFVNHFMELIEPPPGQQ